MPAAEQKTGGWQAAPQEAPGAHEFECQGWRDAIELFRPEHVDALEPPVRAGQLRRPARGGIRGAQPNLGSTEAP